MAIGSPSVVYAIGKPLGALLLGGVILWRVTLVAGPPKGRAIVHVSTTAVEIVVDDDVHRVRGFEETPIVCELRPGRHVVQMIKDGRVLYREAFGVAAGEEVVLTAWDGYDDGRSPERSR